MICANYNGTNTNSNSIQIVQGDTYEAYLEVPEITDTSIVSQCLFSSANWNICQSMPLNGNNWDLTLTAAQTTQMAVGIGTFDITLTFTDNTVATVIYEGRLQILAKRNVCNNG